MAVLFDLSDEIQLVSQAPEDWHVEPEHIFYAIRACGMIAVIIPVFEGGTNREGGYHLSLWPPLPSRDYDLREPRDARLASHR